MKLLSGLVLLLLVSCASRPTLEELEAEAVATGDWAAVEDRERIERKMYSPMYLKCPEHLALICIKNGANEFCSCEPPATGN